MERGEHEVSNVACCVHVTMPPDPAGWTPLDRMTGYHVSASVWIEGCLLDWLIRTDMSTDWLTVHAKLRASSMTLDPDRATSTLTSSLTTAALPAQQSSGLPCSTGARIPIFGRRWRSTNTSELGNTEIVACIAAAADSRGVTLGCHDDGSELVSDERLDQLADGRTSSALRTESTKRVDDTTIADEHECSCSWDEGWSKTKQSFRCS